MGYWYTKTPVPQVEIDGPQVTEEVRRLFVEYLLEVGEALRARKPSGPDVIRVVTTVSLPRLFDASITVFFGDEYYSSFFERTGPEQFWDALPRHRSLLSEWGISLQVPCHERGYREYISDEDYTHEGEIWCFGDIE